MLAAGCVAALGWAPCAAESQAQPPANVTGSTAELGIALPAVGGYRWFRVTQKAYFTPAVMHDIRDNLHASYVRTGWIPGWLRIEKFRWFREDQGFDTICRSGLHVMVILPSPKDDAEGEDDLVTNIGEFFARYTRREFGCLRYAEVVNEADRSVAGFADVQAYASFYERVAPIVAAFGVDVITSGTSGKDLPWTDTLASLLRGAAPPPPVSGYGFHPYGVPPAQMFDALREMRDVVGVGVGEASPKVYVTEIGQKNADDLYRTIVNLAHATPAITIYEYAAQPGESAEYGLKNNPALYAAVQKAWALVYSRGSTATP